MFYTARNISVEVNGSGIFASSAAINSEARVQPQYRTNKAISTRNIATEQLAGGLSLTYYLTGEDPLLACLENENMNLSGNFAGLYFNSGRLMRYSLDMAPYGALQADVEINFYEKIKGSYSPSPSTIPKENVLSVGDVEFSSSSSIGNDKILNMSYHYDTEMAPRLMVGDVEPVGYKMGKKNISFSCASSDLSIDVPLTGQVETASIKLKDSSGNTKETLYINGAMTSQSVSSQEGVLQKEISIQQSNLGLEPKITSFAPNDGPVGTTVTVNGSYFSNAKRVSLFDIPASFNVVSDTSLEFDVPSDPSGMSGPIRIVTHGGEAISSSSFTVGS